MRRYLRFYYGKFLEDSNNLGLHLTVYILEPSKEQFDNRLEELKQDIIDANDDWTGSLVVGPQKAYIELNKAKLSTVISDIIAQFNPVPDWVDEEILLFEKPKGD